MYEVLFRSAVFFGGLPVWGGVVGGGTEKNCCSPESALVLGLRCGCRISFEDLRAGTTSIKKGAPRETNNAGFCDRKIHCGRVIGMLLQSAQEKC